MPNYCDNRVYFVGNSEVVQQLIANVTDEQGRIDFCRARPMPKELSVVQSPTDIVTPEEYQKAVKERDEAIAKKDETPSREEYQDYLADCARRRVELVNPPDGRGHENDEPANFLAELEPFALNEPDPTYQEWVRHVKRNHFVPGLPLTEAMKQEYECWFGAHNWYDWQWKNWGTKWGPFDVEQIPTDDVWNPELAEFARRLIDYSLPDPSEVHATYGYCSAWAPCFSLFKFISGVYSELEVIHPYDSVESEFCGIFVFRSGELVCGAEESYTPFDDISDRSDEKTDWPKEGF